MKTHLLAASLVVAAFLSPVAHAQDDDFQRLESVTVTSSIIDDEDRRSPPAIFRRVKADFFQVEIGATSGSRDAGERKRELEAMFNKLKKSVAATTGYALSGGDLGYSTAPIDTVLFTDIYGDSGAMGSFTLILTVDTREGESFDQAMARATAFAEGIDKSGRAEAYLGDEQYLGLRDTMKHRNDLIADILKDVQDLGVRFRPSIITLTGLESRVITQPSGALELELFIPYTMTIESGREQSIQMRQ